jgi:hypothetical protein
MLPPLAPEDRTTEPLNNADALNSRASQRFQFFSAVQRFSRQDRQPVERDHRKEIASSFDKRATKNRQREEYFWELRVDCRLAEKIVCRRPMLRTHIN